MQANMQANIAFSFSSAFCHSGTVELKTLLACYVGLNFPPYAVVSWQDWLLFLFCTHKYIVSMVTA